MQPQKTYCPPFTEPDRECRGGRGSRGWVRRLCCLTPAPCNGAPCVLSPSPPPRPSPSLLSRPCSWQTCHPLNSQNTRPPTHNVEEETLATSTQNTAVHLRTEPRRTVGAPDPSALEPGPRSRDVDGSLGATGRDRWRPRLGEVAAVAVAGRSPMPFPVDTEHSELSPWLLGCWKSLTLFHPPFGIHCPNQGQCVLGSRLLRHRAFNAKT